MTATNPSNKSHLIPSGEHRSKLIRERCRSSAAFASTRNIASTTMGRTATSFNDTTSNKMSKNEPLLFAALCYKGLEVIFTVVNKKNGVELAVIHARTRVIFQRISLSLDDAVSSDVVALSSSNGVVYTLSSAGTLTCYKPTRADPKLYAFGKYRWGEGCTVNLCDVLGNSPEKLNRGEVVLCSSANGRVLATYRNHVALYDLSEESAVLLWMDKLGAAIDHATLSGDGAAIAVALRGEGVGVPFPYGVRTFVIDGKVKGASTDRNTISNENKGHVRKGSGFGLAPVENPPMPKSSENFDGLMANVFGDAEDNTNVSRKKGRVTYKPGPFLVHSAPVTRLSFRGCGTTTSCAGHNSKNIYEIEEGNDLLLTTCSSDCSVRIFSQNSWRQLMQWNSPPQSRADWVRGISAANLGDLDTSPGNDKKKSSEKGDKGLSPIPKDMSNFSTHYARQHSSGSDAGINQSLMNENLHQTPNPSATPSQSEPGTHAGAWIAELTFRNTFPALRLSRLSYMKSGGDDALPAHFESVAAILPAGSLEESILLDGWNEARMEIEGIWPLWDSWGAAETKTGGESMWVGNLADLNNINDGTQRWLGDGADLGGSHVPPSELRITSCHLHGDCVNQIEMPLWGDKEFGAMEFGSPIRHVMSLPGVVLDPCLAELPSASLEFEAGSRLCARTSMDRRSIDLCWRKSGAINLDEDFATPTSGPKIFRDISLTPLPLRLPSLILPGKPSKQSNSQDKYSVCSLLWWPDESFGGPPRLAALTQSGTIIVFEMPPPWSALEPPMPSYDPFDDAASRGSSVESGYYLNDPSFDSETTDGFDGENPLQYEVSVTPHPDFGIGLRLEAQAVGMPPIAGSFKKHPLSGGRLPAEREGIISVGDELLAVNDVNLEGMPFEKAIATVRQIGFDSFGAPLCMKFRRCKGKRSRESGASFSGSRPSRPQKISRENGSHATVEVGADSEVQQEFGRIVAIVRDVVVGAHDQSCPPAMLLIPWNFGKGATVSPKMYGGALILWAPPGQRTIKAARLEVILDIDPENSRFSEIGSIELGEPSDRKNQSAVKSISYVSSTEKGWLVAILDSAGNTSLLFVETVCADSPVLSSPSNNTIAKFRHYQSVFNVYQVNQICKVDPRESSIFRAFSLELFGCMGSRHGSKELTIWTALSGTSHQTDPNSSEDPYTASKINIRDVKEIPNEEVILDFRWVRSGFLDAFPWLVVFTNHAVLLYRRPCNELYWQPITIVFYECPISESVISPHDSMPHLMSALQCAVLTNDEQRLIRADWHPESILANICTEGKGVQSALKSHTRGLYLWLSQWMDKDKPHRSSWDASGSIASAPFRIVTDKTVVKPDANENDTIETSANLMAAMSLNASAKPLSQEELALLELQKALCPFESDNSQRKESLTKKPLPTPLQSLSRDEQICIWVIGDTICDMPSFKRLDSLSELSLFSFTIMKRLLDAKEKSTIVRNSNPGMVSYIGGRPVFARQESSALIEQTRVKQTSASAGFLSALMSGTQSRLIEACRPKEEKFTWETARAVGIPFWVRSEKSLVSLAEEIAQTVYKSTKAVMDCALYYVAMRNMKKLRAIAATDRSDSGKKFFTFITDHDFKSDRGRSAAEKNAYSLLRKRKYASAAAFFLLAEPPMIKTALNIIKSQMQDVSLAFLVARLMEYASKSQAGSSSDSLTIGGGFNLSSMGGGGGFAGSGSVSIAADVEEYSVPFCQWEPNLGIHARSILRPEIECSSDGGDNCFDCLQLLWLDRPNDAMLRLAQMPASRRDDVMISDCVTPFITVHEEDSSQKSNETHGDVISRTNAVINFCSGPTLLKALKPRKRILWSSALVVSRALSRCGIEIPSMRIILEVADPGYNDDNPSQAQRKVHKSLLSKKNGIHHQTNNNNSSIFDSFDSAPSKPKAKPVVDPMSSSIFDSFDAGPSKPKFKPQPATDPMSSSIFDSFDVTPSKPKVKPQPATDPMSSSIFDSFDVKPSKPQPATDPMSSSIFDSFDVTPPRPKTKPQTAADPMSSSISDSFDMPATNKATPVSTGQGVTLKDSAARSNNPQEVIVKEEPISIPDFSLLWKEWREQSIRVYAASRLLRELARISSSFHCEPHYNSIESFIHHHQPPISAGSYEVFHKPCDGEGLIATILSTLNELKSAFSISEEVIIEQALELISASATPRRLACTVLLQCLLGRSDLAENTIRDASLHLMSHCESLGLSNECVVNHTDLRCFISSHWARRNYENIILQLETSMWLHRGGVFDACSTTEKEALLAVRVGLATVNWGCCHQTLDTLIKAEPDCPVDFDVGRNLWRSMKIISFNENAISTVEGVTSGGWEFLVDCRREEATEMLRDGLPGQFLIRPHPQDPGVFTISFKTNLIPTDAPPVTNYDDSGEAENDKPQETPSPSKIIKRGDVVQHAIIRLTDTGFRCGSFGPFATLTKLLEAVSGSLPFDLRFNEPPVKGIIKERGVQSSPNSFLFKKLALQSTTDFIHVGSTELDDYSGLPASTQGNLIVESGSNVNDVEKRKFGLFAQLLFLSSFRKQLCAVAAARIDEPAPPYADMPPGDGILDDDYDGTISEGSLPIDEEENLHDALRMVRPLLNWCRAKEIEIVDEISPLVCDIRQHQSESTLSVSINATADELEIPSANSAADPVKGCMVRGDAMIRNCIQPDSGVDFRTLRVGEPGNSVIVVLFGKDDAVKWLASHETGGDENEAQARLKNMELMRVIEPITWSDLSLPKGYAASHPSANLRYRFVDPWEVEPLESKAGETASAALGRGRYQTLTVGLIASACEHAIRTTGGLHLLGLWSTLRGGLYLTKALCSAHPSWERDSGGDLLMREGFLMEPSPYENSIRQHLYGNSLFRSLKLPQRFVALVQVDLLDLKNVTTPSGTSSLTAYAMLRLKRKGGSAPLNHKARSLDSAITQSRKISKISGPNAPASWGSIVRFRFPLPEDVNCEGKSYDSDRESLFKGPPTCLQVTVYEKKFMSDVELGGADVSLESLGTGGQIEEWVPLRVGKDGITWFARMRISLRFELMCLDSAPVEEGKEDRCPSIGLKKIRNLSRLGAHEDHSMKSSISTPQLTGFFGNMLY